MPDFRKFAQRVDKKMEQLIFSGVKHPDEILHHMVGYLPDMHRLWTTTTDEQLMYLSAKFPYFKEFALILEAGFQAERNKHSRSYDGLVKFTEEQRSIVEGLVQRATDIEESLGRGGHRSAIADIWSEWKSEFTEFIRKLACDGVDPRVVHEVENFFQPTVTRVNGMLQETVKIQPDILSMAEKIHDHVISIESQGGGYEQLLFILNDHADDFKVILESADPHQLSYLTQTYDGFFRYAKIMESLAQGVADGSVSAPLDH